MATATTTQAPATLPAIAEVPKNVIKRLISIFPKVATGNTVEISPELWELRQYAKAAVAAWEEQAMLAEIKIRQQLGDAEKGTVNGVVVVKRHQDDVKGYSVGACTKDYLKAATS